MAELLMAELEETLSQLIARFESLERRVSALEGQTRLAPSPAAQADIPKQGSHPAAVAVPQAESPFSVAGKAMLGIAGAYVLRAIAESDSLPRLAVVILAIAYAGMWLVWAARARSDAHFTQAAYAATSALILAPMLAELTLRFQVLPASMTAELLSAYVITASVLAWRKTLVSVSWITCAAAVLTALGLLVISHDLVPYTAALLLIAAVIEFAAAMNRWPSLRWFVAPVADLAVGILLYIQSLPENSRPDYPSVSTSALLALPSLLFLIYGASIAWRTAILRRRITALEILQAAIAFPLAAVGWLWFAGAAGRMALGVCCWALAAACYTAAFARFDRFAEHRNYHVYSTWSVALVLTGSFLLLPQTVLVLFLSGVAVAAILLGVRMGRLTPEFHGLVYLTTAAFASGLLSYAGRALAGTFPTVPGWIVWVAAASAILCYSIGGRFPGDRWNEKLLRLLATALGVSAVATFLVSCLVWLAAVGMTLSPAHIAVIRTLIPCSLSLALAFAGSRWRRAELVWTAYGTLAFVTVKLLFEDLPHGHSGAIAISIFLYAITLIAIPRLARDRS